MKLFQKLIERIYKSLNPELYQTEKLATYKCKITYYQSIIDNSKISIKELENTLKFYEDLLSKDVSSQMIYAKVWLDSNLKKYLENIDSHLQNINTAESALTYYKILLEDLEKKQKLCD